MVTVVNNPGTERVVEVDKGDSAAGWAVAVVVLIAVVAVGAYFWMHRAAYQAPADNTSGATVNVTVPAAGYQPPADNSQPAQ